MTEVGFNGVLAQRKRVIIRLLAAKEGCPLIVCSWAMVIMLGTTFKSRFDEIVIRIFK